jgi:hypothetical protein
MGDKPINENKKESKSTSFIGLESGFLNAKIKEMPINKYG